MSSRYWWIPATYASYYVASYVLRVLGEITNAVMTSIPLTGTVPLVKPASTLLLILICIGTICLEVLHDFFFHGVNE